MPWEVDWIDFADCVARLWSMLTSKVWGALARDQARWCDGACDGRVRGWQEHPKR